MTQTTTQTLETIDYIREEVLPVLREHGVKLSEINSHLARQNERIAHAEERSQTHTQKLNAHADQLSAVFADVRAIQAVEAIRGDQQKDQRDKIWKLGIELAKLVGAGGVAAMAIKALELLS